MSREFTTVSLASGGFAPRPPPGLRHWTPLGDFRPLFRIPFRKILDPPLHLTTITVTQQSIYISQICLLKKLDHDQVRQHYLAFQFY